MRQLVEVLTFQGCPNAEPATALAKRVIAETGVEATVRRVNVSSPADAVDRQFLGSPTIRVNGVDVEPGASERQDYVLACRVYRTSAGIQGEPDERWLRDALRSTG